MGVNQSKPLELYSSKDIAETLERRGQQYGRYADAVRVNGVDGAYLASLDAKEWNETVQELQITSSLHVRILRKEWEAASAFSANKPPETISISTTRSSISPISPSRASLSIDEFYDKASPEELKAFDDIASRAMDGCKALYAGVHVLEDEGMVSLSSNFVLPDGSRQVQNLVRKGAFNRCFAALMENDSDYTIQQLNKGESMFQKEDETAWYTGHVVRGPDGERIGIVCTVTREPDKEDKEVLLKQLAEEAQKQLQLRGVLLRRNRTLQEQIERARPIPDSSVRTPIPKDAYMVTRHEPSLLKPITASQISNHHSAFPEYEADPRLPKRTAMLPSVRAVAATDAEMQHLPSDYYDPLDSQGVDRIPVGKDDMDRCAVAESLGLTEMREDSTTAIALQRFAEMASNLFDVEQAAISHIVQDNVYMMASHITNQGEEKEEHFYNESSTRGAPRFNRTGEPFLTVKRRCDAACNYPITMRRTVVFRDLSEDNSFNFQAQGVPLCFYAGSPIIIQGHVVCTLCLLDSKPRPKFGPMEEIQMEQITQLIVQQIENWALRRDMEKLQRERQLLASQRLKTRPPETEAALVFTDIQGSTSLWESSPEVMNEALALHDKIMRRCISECNGYEVCTEGDAFHIAFHDPADAVNYALKAQQTLYEAPWSDELLALSEASEDVSGRFRGVRVRIAIHWGKVDSRENEVSGRREYSGDTYHIAKSTEHLCHGGQILVTSDVWNVASYLAETMLDSPQVIDLGMHVLCKGKAKDEGVIAKTMIQLVPAPLAYDYFQHRKSSQGQCTGRQFPSISSKVQRTRSFHDAPYENNSATICFVYTSEVEKSVEDPAVVLASLSRLTGSLLMKSSSTGYHCKDFMLAFSDLSDAVRLALALQKDLASTPVEGVDLAGLIQIGIHDGPFTTMGPSPQTGRADYFGKVVNRAARVASVTEPGKVYVAAATQQEPSLESGLTATFLEWKMLKGVQEKLALYVCTEAT